MTSFSNRPIERPVKLIAYWLAKAGAIWFPDHGIIPELNRLPLFLIPLPEYASIEQFDIRNRW
jgi:hypothetical protein